MTPTEKSLLRRLDAVETQLADLRRRVEKNELAREKRKAERARRYVGDALDGTLIRDARRAAGWTQTDLAAAIGSRKHLISLYERGASRVPRWRARAIVTVFAGADAEPPAWTSADLAEFVGPVDVEPLDQVA